MTRDSRAVIRPIEPGNSAVCVHCGTPGKFVARAQGKQVIANVYENGTWVRVEHFHSEHVLEGNQSRRKGRFKDKYGASVGRQVEGGLPRTTSASGECRAFTSTAGLPGVP